MGKFLKIGGKSANFVDNFGFSVDSPVDIVCKTRRVLWKNGGDPRLNLWITCGWIGVNCGNVVH